VSALLKRIVVKNVGVLKAFYTPRAPQLERLTSFYARNGRGKTTLSAILRSAGMNDPVPILGRRTLGRQGVNPEVILIFENGKVRFDNDRWQESIGRIDVFDGDFISDNLYAGESVELTHDRSLFTIILGKAGVKLAKHQEFFVAAAKRTVAVGTRVTPRPPHRSELALLTHSAPASGI
jgi:wobble nucleotide-excising tRNase